MNAQGFSSRFTELLSNEGADRFVIVVSQVDPDALASAFAMREILGILNSLYSNHVKQVPEVFIYCAGSISHPQNRSIINRFNLLSEFTSLKDLQTILSEGSTKKISFILVDSSDLDDKRLPAELLDALRNRTMHKLFIVDHHRSTAVPHDGRDVFWIDSVGAASTMIYELGHHISCSFSQEVKTLLALGIYTDTLMLIEANHRDHAAYGELAKAIDPHEFGRLVRYPLPPSHFHNFRYALDNMFETDGILLVSAGSLPSEEGDDLSTIADSLIRRNDINTVIVFGILDGKQVRVSVRSTDMTKPLEQRIQGWFNAGGAKLTPNGVGSGGVVLALDLGFWSSRDPAVAAKLEEFVAARMKEVIFHTS